MRKRTVKLHGHHCQISVHREGKHVWFAVGDYLGKEIRAQAESERAAVNRWRETASKMVATERGSFRSSPTPPHYFRRPVSASHIFHPQRDIHRPATAACRWPQRSSHGSRGHRQSRSLSSRIAPPDMTRPRRHLLLSSEWERPSRTKFASESCRANLIAFQKSGFEESKRP